ncbi:MAG: ribosome maturation factor RimM [Actinobacteria bacterium]|nr:ribosome maturation factor RimM [Actinomycetota bacterium]
MPNAKSGKAGARQPQAMLAVGRVVRPHGVRGALLVEPYSTAIAELRSGSRVFLGPHASPATVTRSHAQVRGYLLSLRECLDRESAEAWRGAEVRVPVEAVPPLPEGTYYHGDILGLVVVSSDGTNLGQVVEILQTGANDVYIVRDAQDQELLLPAIASVIREVDLSAGRLVVDLIPGLRE